MPFRPLPSSFLDLMGTLARSGGLVADLGCGDGAFAALLGADVPRVVGVDRARPPGPATTVVGDVLDLPLRPASCDVVVAANLVRHLAPRHRRYGFLAAWRDLLKPGGSLFVFEDAVRRKGGPAGHYGRLQEFLARLAPDQRGPLLRREDVLRHLPGAGLVMAAGGEEVNTWPLDADAVVALLRRGRPRPGDEAAALADAIARDGLACGPYWWVRLERGEERA